MLISLSFSHTDDGLSDTNLALQRPSFQTSTAYGASAYRAVDGNRDSNYGSDSCTHTAGDINPWWAVDLQQKYYIHHLIISNRGNSMLIV